MSRGKSEKIKAQISDAQSLVRESKLDVKTRRALRGIIRQKHGLRDIELLKEINELLADCEKEEKKTPRKKYAEIIIGESLN